MEANIDQAVAALDTVLSCVHCVNMILKVKCGSKIVRPPGIKCFYYSSVLDNSYWLGGAPRRAVCCVQACRGVSRFTNIVLSAPKSRDHNRVSVSKGTSRGEYFAPASTQRSWTQVRLMYRHDFTVYVN